MEGPSLWVLGAVLAIFLLLLAPGVSAEPVGVEVGVYMLNVGKYNMEDGSYVADFYLWLEWDDSQAPGGFDPSNFEFMNGRAQDIKLQYQEPGYLFYRVLGEFYRDTDLRDFPLDEQTISIQLEDEVLTAQEMVYIPHHNGSALGDGFDVLGWVIKGANASISSTPYSIFGEDYSRFNYDIVIGRRESALFEVLLPVLFIGFTAWLCFFFPLRKLGEKMTLGGTALLSAVAFHIYLTASIPAVGYITIADKIIIVLYTFLVTTLAGLVVVESHIGRERHHHAKRLNHSYKALSLLAPLAMMMVLMYV